MKLTHTLLVAGLSLLIGSQLQAQVVINEVSAANLSTIADGFGDFEDWAELYNPTGSNVDISGYYFSDSQNNNLKWQFPPNSVVPANGYFMVYCSGRNLGGAGFAHADIKLKQSSDEWVVLSDATGTIVDDFQLIDNTKEDHSRGRTTDGAQTWDLFTTPTPNASNTGSVPQYTPRATFAPAAGFYNAAQTVTLTSPDPAATIYYTTDGSEPTVGSTVYAGPINVNQTTVIRAACFNGSTGAPISFIETDTYFINEVHTLAVLSISGTEVDDLLNGNIALTPTGHIEYFGEDQLLRDEGVGEYNKHGNDSWAYDQRGFDFIMRDQFGYNDAIHYPIFRTKNRDEFQRVIVKAAANDNYSFENGAHIRDSYVNALSHEADLKLDERTFEPCIVYMNGQYWGVYDIREKVDDHDFIKHYYDQDREDIQFLKTWGATWAEYGDNQAITDWNNLVAYIANNNMGDPALFALVDTTYNWESLLDYVILNGFIVSADWLNWNTAWWRGLDPNGQKKRWRYALWDMDATFGHYINYTGVPTTGPSADPCDPEILGDPGGQGHIPILNKLIAENEGVREYYVNRYIDLSNTTFQCDHMHAFLDSLIDIIEPEMQRQVTRWGVGSLAGWQTNVQTLKTFIDDRCASVTTGLTTCYDITGPHEVLFNVDPPMSGAIQINSITPPLYPFVGNYYGNIVTNLEAKPAAGWRFGFWTIKNDTIMPSLTDSIAWLTIDVTDTITAHFIPPITHDVVLNVDTVNAARILFNNQIYSTFPQVVSVPEGVPVQIQVFPELYYDWLGWDVANTSLAPFAPTDQQMTLTFFGPDTITALLDAQEYAYYVPNSFTPNGDGHNDVWLPLGSAVQPEDFTCQVYDRFGHLVFETADWQTGWDGTISGTLASTGVYAYRISLRNGITQQKFELFGHVTSIR